MTIARGVLWNWLGLTVTSIVSFATMPIMIHQLGAYYYGLWMLLNSIIGYYGLLDFGITTSMRRFTSRLKGADEPEKLYATLLAGLQITAAAAVVIIVASLLSGYAAPKFIDLKQDNVSLLRTLLVLMGFSVAITFPARTLAAYLHGLQRLDLYNIGSILNSVLRGCGIVTVLWMGYGVVAVAVITLGASLISLVYYSAAVLYLDPKLFTYSLGFSWDRIRELLGFSFFVFLNTIGDYFRFHLDSIVIARYLAVALVTPFAVAASLMTYFITVMFSVSSPLMNEQSRLDGAGRFAESRLFFLRSTTLTSTVALLGGVLLICNGKMLLALWLGRDLLIAFPVLVALTVAYVSDLGQGPSIYLLRSRGRHQPLAYWTIAEGIANLALSIALCRRYGILGVALGTMIPMLITKLLIQPWYVLRIADVRVADYFSAIAKPCFVAMTCLAAYSVLPAPAPSLAALVVSIVWQIALFGVLTYGVVLNAEQRRSLGRFMQYFRPVTSA